MQADTQSSFFAGRLQAYLKGGVVQATAGNLAIKGLGETEAAQAARLLRAKKASRSVQQDGVMYTEKVRQITQERECNKVEKVQAALTRARAKEARKEKLE